MCTTATGAWCAWKCQRTWLATSLGSLPPRERCAAVCQCMGTAPRHPRQPCVQCGNRLPQHHLQYYRLTTHVACSMSNTFAHCVVTVPMCCLPLLCSVVFCAVAAAQTQGQEVNTAAPYMHTFSEQLYEQHAASKALHTAGASTWTPAAVPAGVSGAADRQRVTRSTCGR